MNAMVVRLKRWWGFPRSYLCRPLFLINPPRPPPPQPELLEVVIESSTPPPNDDLSSVPAPNANSIAESSPTTMHLPFHSIVDVMRELKLGKFFLNIGVPVITAVLTSTRKFHATSFAIYMLLGLLIGLLKIWNGMMLRTTFPRTAKVFELLGIIMVLLSFIGLMASQLPPKFIWVIILCYALSLFPFLIQFLLIAQHTCNMCAYILRQYLCILSKLQSRVASKHCILPLCPTKPNTS